MSSFCPFAPFESFLVAKVSIGERRRCGDFDRVVTGPLLARAKPPRRSSSYQDGSQFRVSSRKSYH